MELVNKQKSSLIRDLEDQKHSLDKSLTKATNVTGDKKGLLDSNQQITGLNGQIMQLKQEIESISKLVRKVSDQLEKALYDKKQLADMLEDAKERSARVQKALDEQIKVSSLHSNDTDEAAKFLQQQKDEAQGKVHELEDEISRLNNNIQVLFVCLFLCKLRHKYMFRLSIWVCFVLFLGIAIEKNEELDDTNQNQQKMMVDLRAQLSSVNSASGDSQNQINELSAKNRKLNAEVAELKAQNQKLEEQCEKDMKVKYCICILRVFVFFFVLLLFVVIQKRF